MKAKINQYDKLIILYIISLVFGVYGGALTASRIFTIICFPFFIMDKKNNNKRSYKFELFFFIFWIIYALISIFWSIDQTEASKSVIYLSVNFFSFFTLIWMCNKANYPKKSIINGWMLAFVLTIPVALVEIFFNIHLSTNYMESYLGNFNGEFVQRNLASVTFENINGYSVFLCYISPFVFIDLIKERKVIKWIIAFFLVLIILINSSRGAFLCIFVNLVLLLFYLNKNKIKSVVYIFMTCIIGFVCFLYLDEYFKFISMRFKTQGFEDLGRIDVINNGFDALINSNFFGVGAGNFVNYMQINYSSLVTAPHNLFLEILVQYGLVIFIGFVILGYRIYKISRNRMPFNNIAMVLGLLTLIFSSFIDSGYLLGSVLWIFLASVYILVDYRY